MDFSPLRNIISDKSITDEEVAKQFDDFFIKSDADGKRCNASELDELLQISELLRGERPIAAEIFKNMQLTEDRCSRCMIDPGNHNNHIGK